MVGRRSPATRDVVVNIPFGGGVSEGEDSLIMQPPHLATLTNGKLNKDGSIRRRRPATQRDITGISSRGLQNKNSLFNHEGNTLVLNSNEGPFVWSSDTQWSNTGQFGQPPLEIKSEKDVACSNYYADSAVSGNYIAYVQKEADGIYFTAFQYDTKALACPKTLISTVSANHRNPKIMAAASDGVFYVAYQPAAVSSYLIARIDANAFPSATITHTQAFTTGGTTFDQFDMCMGPVIAPHGQTLYFAYNDGTNIRIRRLKASDLTVLNSFTHTLIGGAEGMGVHFNALANRVYVAGFDSAVDATHVLTRRSNLDFSVVLPGASFVIEASLHANLDYTAMECTWAYSGVGGSEMFFAFSVIARYAGSTYFDTSGNADGVLGQHGCVQSFTVDSSMALVDTIASAWNYCLATKAWNPVDESTRPYVGLLRINTVGAHHFDGAHTFAYDTYEESLQNTILICSFADRLHADKNGLFLMLKVAGRCHDNMAASPAYYSVTLAPVTFFPTNVQYVSRLSFVSAVPEGFHFSRPVYDDIERKDLAIRTYPLTFQPPTVLAGTFGHMKSTSISWATVPRAKDSTQGLSQIASGYLGSFDGENTRENTSHSYPEYSRRTDFTFPATDLGSSPVTDQVLTRVCYVYAWTDANGVLHRSAPSLPFNAFAFRNDQFGAGRADFLYSLEAPCTDFPLSAFTTDDENRYLELYITGVTGIDDTFYRAFRVKYDTSTFGDMTVDADRPWVIHIFSVLRLKEIPGPGELNENNSPYNQSQILYTFGDILESLPPPSLLDIVATKDRLWGISAEDQNTVYFSKPLEIGISPEFNDALTLPMLTGSGPCTAISALDEKVIIFKNKSIYVVTGDGPNALGAGSSFPVPQSISTDVGCIAKQSVVRGPFGILFQGDLGIYLLDRGLNLTWLSKPVDDTIGNTPVLCGTLVPEESHVRFVYNANGDAVVWDYEQNQWAKYTGIHEKHGVSFGGGWAGVLTDTGTLQFTQEVASSGSANGMYAGASLPLSFTTAWLKLTELEGFQRVKRALFLYRPGNVSTDYEGLEVTEAVNYRPAITATHTWSPAAASALPNKQQYEVHVKSQKCESIQLGVREVPIVSGNVLGPDAVFSGLNLLVGSKGTTFRHLRDGSKR